ncbi:MAG: glycosyltransferase family 4 protein [Bacteroidales bacterium]|nr:glycosyltransferase family 4 protein [Bacteroidales bacterium]
MKILYIVAHRLGRSPGQRFRFEQYLKYLEESGFNYEISNFLNEKDDKIFYSKGKYFKKFIILLKSIRQRLKDIKRANEFDIIFIYRDAIMIGSTYFEKQFSKSKARVIFDFDDAIWYPETSQGNSNLSFLKKPSKTGRIIELSDLVFAGNSYLADYALQYNKNVRIVPTTIDINYYIKKERKKSDNKICIGWTGTSTTLKHYELIIPVLKRIKDKYGDKIYFKLISDQPLLTKELEIENTKWDKETEIEDLSYIDIGIMPLPDDKWSKGKCGFKGLQYMALEIPALMSAVGVNNEIIQDGINGFLAKNDEEWYNKLCLLLNSPELRKNIGLKGRQTIVEKYSCQALKEKYIEYFKELI